MDKASKVPAQQSSPQWPQVPAEFKKIYYMADPIHQTDPPTKLVVMTWDTWTDVGTQLEHFRRLAKDQDKRIKELLGANEILGNQVNDATQRLNNLREIRRGEKRVELEKELILPGDPRSLYLKGH